MDVIIALRSRFNEFLSLLLCIPGSYVNRFIRSIKQTINNFKVIIVYIYIIYIKLNTEDISIKILIMFTSKSNIAFTRHGW